MFIADTFQITADFDNTSPTSGDIGYNPMYLLNVPAGVTFNNATFLGTAVSKSLIGACATVGGCAYPVPDLYDINGNASTVNVLEGETLYVLRYPLGSFTDDQPAQRMILNFTLGSPPAANLGVDRVVKLTPFFSLGTTPELEQGDKSIVGTEDTVTVTPSVIRHTKTITAPETETATGPNYTRTVTLTVDVATGETVSNLVVTDNLDAGMQFVAVTDADGCTPDTSGVLPGPDGNLIFNCGGPITGVPGDDKTITFTFYVPAILDSTSGASQNLTNSSEAGADYSTYPRQTATDSASITARSIAIQKAASILNDVGAVGLSPGDTLQYTLSGQVSDYFEFGSVIINDTLGDGQTFDTSYTPTWSVNSNGDTHNDVSFVLNTNYTVAAQNADGETVVSFNLSAAMTAEGMSGLITGDNIDGDFVDGPSTFTITLRSTVVSLYVADQAGTESLTVGDSVGNNVTTQGNVVPSGVTQSEGSTTTLSIGPPLTVEKSLYAYNGSTTIPSNLRVIPGDTVTYRLGVPLSFTSYEHLKVTDFLPVPFLAAAELTNGEAQTLPVPPAVVPLPGDWCAGPDNKLALPAGVDVNTAQNTLTWNIGTNELQTGVNLIEILFTVTATNKPMADGLNLANLSILEYDNSNGPSAGSSVAELLPTGEPALEIEKVITGISNVSASCGAFPSTACSNVDAGDQVSYQITIENTGNAPAYNIQLTDDEASAANFGSAGISALVVSVAVDPAGSEANLFAPGGLTLQDSLAPGDSVTINYTGTVPQTRSPGPDIVNKATIKNFASTDGGPNYATNPASFQDITTVALRGIQGITKTITGSSIVAAANPPGTIGGNINRGETIDFTITVTLSEGTYYNFALTDTYPGVIPPVTCGAGGFSCNNASVDITGTIVTVPDTIGNTTGQIIYTYKTLPLVSSSSNTATINANDYNGTPLPPQNSLTVPWTLDNPDPVIDKVSMLPLLRDAGQTVDVTLTWRNTDTSNPLFQCVITDILPVGMFDWTTAAPAEVTTPAGYTFAYNAGTGRVTYTQNDKNAPLPSGAAAVNVTATFRATIRTDVVTGSTYTNNASITGRTLPLSVENASGINRTASDSLDYLIPSSTAATKILTGTSQPDAVTAGPNVAVGETFTYDMTFTLPRGITQNVILADVMTTGYDGVTLVGATLAHNTDNILPLKLVSANNPNNIDNAGADVAVDVLADMESCPPGTPPNCPAANMFTLPLGNVNNSSGAAATYTLKVTLRVDNVLANNNNRVLEDRPRIYWNTSLGGQTNNPDIAVQTVTVRLPVVGVAKTPSTLIPNAGDTVTYTLIVRNNANPPPPLQIATAPGFDWTFQDTLPAEFITPTVISTVYTGSLIPVPTITAGFGGNDLTGTISRLDPGDFVTITYTAVVDPATLFRTTLPNAARAETTTLPGAVANERDGTGAPVENDLFATTSASVTTSNPVLAAAGKSVVGAGPFAIGDIVHYQIVLDVPVGTGTNMTIEDKLPLGLTFVSAAPNAPTLTMGGGVTNAVLTSHFLSPTITFTVNNIIADPLGTITIDYYAQVQNIVDNQGGDALLNTAEAFYNSVSVGTDSETITVGEPVADMTKSVISGATAAIPGSIVRWQFTVENTGDTTAWQTDISDPLPAGLNQISDVTVSQTGGVLNDDTPPVTVSATDAILSGPGNNTIAFNDLVFPPGASITVEFDSVVMNTITPGRLLNNIVTATFASQDTGVSGPGSEVRDGADGLGGPLNDYYQSTNQTFGFRLNRNAMKFENPTCTACDPSCPTGAGFFVRVEDDDDGNVNDDLDLTNAGGTIEAWIQATSCRASDVDAGIVIKGTANACYGFGLSGGSLFDDGSGSDDAQNIGFRLGPNVLVAKDHLIQPGKWYHVACVWDTGSMSIYINGVLEATQAVATIVPVNDEDLILGQQTVSPGGPFQYYGNIDEFRLWNVARDVDDIRDNMCRTLPLNPPAPYPVPGLAVYLQSDEDNGDIQDISGNGNKGVFSDASRTCSAAPLGDDSEHDYVGGGPNFNQTIGNLAGTESIKVEEDGGSWGSGPADKSGLQVYWTEIPPEPASGPFAWKPLTERGYYGVFVTGGTAPTYKVTYTYAPAGIGDEDNLDMLTRSENCMPWRTSDATPNAGLNTITKTLQSGTEYILGVPMDPRNAILFDGNDDYVSVADAGAGPLRLTTDGTMEAWIYITNYQTDAGIVCKGDTTDGYSLYTDNTTGDQILFSLYVGGASTTVTSNATLNANTWYHIAATWADADVMHLYINGVLDNSAGAWASGDTTGSNLTIGLGSGTYFKGLIDEVRVWNTARDQVEIRSAMCRKVISTEPEIANLVGYWRFDEETDSATCADSSGKNRVGTMNTTAPGFSDIRDSRRCSSAPIGDGSAYDYFDLGPVVSTQLSHPKGDYMFATANLDPGSTWNVPYSGLHIYRIDAPPVYPPDLWDTALYPYTTPNGMTPPYPPNASEIWSSIDYYRYWGIFITDWDDTHAPAYDADYYYDFNPSVPDGADGTASPSPQIGLAKRPDYCFGTWSDGGAFWDFPNLRLRLSGEYQFGTPGTSVPTNPEYVLGGINQPLAITLASFTATIADGCIVVSWETATEIDTAGFYLWRSDQKDGVYTRIDDSFTRSEAKVETSGASYRFKDCEVNVKAGTYYYKLEEVDMDNTNDNPLYGPITPAVQPVAASETPKNESGKSDGGNSGCFIGVMSGMMSDE